MTATVAASHPHALDVLDDPVEQQRFTRWVERADGSRVADSAFALSGMVCAACAGQIEAALHQVDGVLEARVSASAHSAQVRWDPARTAPSALVLAVRGAGYDAVPDTAASARELRRNERRKALWRLFVASFCAMQVMMFATPSYVAEGAELADDMRQLLNWGVGWCPCQSCSSPPALFARRLAQPQESQDRHGRARQPRHCGDLCGQQWRHVFTRRRVWPRGLF
ncbi:cation transporter [Ideonella paludis]|uniref:cation transporter n=1 Tax=Ideonella paludis TaxID=1233411 RepID=UPI0036397990